MSKSAPAPDYRGAAEEQAQSSREVTEQQTWANRPDQHTPFGSQTWSNEQVWDPSTQQYLNRWNQYTTLDPQMQAALDSQQALNRNRSDLGNALFPRAAQEFGNAMDWSQFSNLSSTPQGSNYDRSSLPSAVTGVDTTGMQNVDSGQRYYDQAGNAVMEQFNRRQEPAFQEQQAQLDATLRARGVKPGDAAYDNELNKLRTQQSDARQQAMSQATQMAGQEASRMFGMDQGSRQQQFQEALQGAGLSNQARQQLAAEQLQFGQAGFGQALQQANYQNTLRQQQIAEEMQRRGFSLNEINALISGQQVGMPSMPGFNQANRAETTQYMQAAQNQYQADKDAADAANAMTGQLLSSAAGFASI